jgi:Glutaredoxin-like domain (DUF836)
MSEKNSSAVEASGNHQNPGIQQAEVRFYCVEHCRICNEARALISRIGVFTHFINIMGNDNLFDKYRLRIPVLQRVDNNAELDGPFDTQTVFRFLMSPVYASGLPREYLPSTRAFIAMEASQRAQSGQSNPRKKQKMDSTVETIYSGSPIKPFRI